MLPGGPEGCISKQIDESPLRCEGSCCHPVNKQRTPSNQPSVYSTLTRSQMLLFLFHSFPHFSPPLFFTLFSSAKCDVLRKFIYLAAFPISDLIKVFPFPSLLTNIPFKETLPPPHHFLWFYFTSFKIVLSLFKTCFSLSVRVY